MTISRHRYNIAIIALLVILQYNSVYSFEFENFTAKEREKLEKGEILKEYNYIEDKAIHSGHGIGIIDAPVEMVWSIITDFNNYPEFTPSIVKSRIVDPAFIDKIKTAKIKNPDDVEEILGNTIIESVIQDPDDLDKFYIYHYQRSNLPWPINDTWTILKMNHDKSKWTQKWILIAGDLKQDYGSWQLHPYGAGKTVGEYTTNLDLGISIPKFLIGIIMNITGPGLIKGLRTQSEKIIIESKTNSTGE